MICSNRKAKTINSRGPTHGDLSKTSLRPVYKAIQK